MNKKGFIAYYNIIFLMLFCFSLMLITLEDNANLYKTNNLRMLLINFIEADGQVYSKLNNHDNNEDKNKTMKYDGKQYTKYSHTQCKFCYFYSYVNIIKIECYDGKYYIIERIKEYWDVDKISSFLKEQRG